MFSKLFLVSGALSGAAGVVLGALTAHGLRDRLEVAAVNALETASLYLLVHGLLLTAVALWHRTLEEVPGDVIVLRVTGVLLLAGVCLFCGSLSAAHLGGMRSATALAPLGGMALITGWLGLAVFGLWKQ